MRKFNTALLSILLILVLFSAPAFAVRQGGSFVWIAPYGSDLQTLDPAKATDEQDALVVLNIFRCLYRWDGVNSTYKLDLADREEVSADGLTYTYHLKRNVKFHNGRQMKADDVIYSYQRIMDPEKTFSSAGYLASIKGAKEYNDKKADRISGLKKIDDFTLAITFTNPIEPGYLLWQPFLAIVPKEAAEKEAFASNPVGCGPFKFVRWVKGNEIELEKFEGYYEAGLPYLDKLSFKILSDSAARDMAFRAKELDANLLGASQYAAYKKDPELSKRIVEVAEMFMRHVRFNPNWELPDGRKPFSDLRVRQAFNYAIDSDLIIKKYAKGKAFPAVSFLAPTTPGFDKNGASYRYDLKKAKQLMKEAGYEKGFPLEIIGTASSSYGTGVVEVIMPFLKKINIDCKPVTLEGAAKYDRQRAGDYQGNINSYSAGPDPYQALYLFHSKNPVAKRNKAAWKVPGFDEALDAAAAASSKAEKIKQIQKANSILQEQAFFWFYNYNKAAIAYHPWVHGIQKVGVEMMYQDFTEVWVDASSPRATAN